MTDFFRKALDNLSAAKLLFENGLYDASANRAYYAAFHGAVAALAAKGITRDRLDHEWVQSQFNGRLIKREKVFPGKIKSFLSEMQAIRNIADYKLANVNRKMASRQIDRAEEMVRPIGKVLEI